MVGHTVGTESDLNQAPQCRRVDRFHEYLTANLLTVHFSQVRLVLDGADGARPASCGCSPSPDKCTSPPSDSRAAHRRTKWLQ
jgi:hypothetical protein